MGRVTHGKVTHGKVTHGKGDSTVSHYIRTLSYQNSISAQAGHKEGTKLSAGLPTTSSCVELSLENLQSIFEPHSPCRIVYQTSLIPRLSSRLGMRLAPNTVIWIIFKHYSRY